MSQEQWLCPRSDMEIHYATVKAMKGTEYPLCPATALQSRDFAELVSACVQIQAGTAPQLIRCDSNNFLFVCLFLLDFWSAADCPYFIPVSLAAQRCALEVKQITELSTSTSTTHWQSVLACVWAG